MTLGLLLAIVFTLGWIPLFVFRVEAVYASLPIYGRAERMWVRASPIVVAIHVAAACILLSRTGSVHRMAAVAGLGLFAAGLGVWFWGRMLIGPLRVRRTPDEPPQRLRRDGAFGIVRHPLYFGMLLLAAAPVAALPRRMLGLTLALAALVIAVRAVQEERRLRAQLGAAYDDYCREVKRLVPFVW